MALEGLDTSPIFSAFFSTRSSRSSPVKPGQAIRVANQDLLEKALNVAWHGAGWGVLNGNRRILNIHLSLACQKKKNIIARIFNVTIYNMSIVVTSIIIMIVTISIMIIRIYYHEQNWSLINIIEHCY